MSLSNKLTLDKVDVKGKRVVMRWALIIAWQLASAGTVAANRKWDYWWASPKCRVCSSCGGRLFGAHTQWCEGIKVMAKWCLSRFSPTGRRQEVNSSVVTFSFHVTCLCGDAAWMDGWNHWHPSQSCKIHQHPSNNNEFVSLKTWKLMMNVIEVFRFQLRPQRRF